MVAWKQKQLAQSPKPQRKELKDVAVFQDPLFQNFKIQVLGEWVAKDRTQQSHQLFQGGEAEAPL